MPANLRINPRVPFPALVLANRPVTITKQNGVWTIGFDITSFGTQSPPASAYATDFLLGYDQQAGVYFKISLATLLAAAQAPQPSFDTAAGDYPVTIETVLLINKAVPAAHNINLPAASLRGGAPITVKDYAGNAAANVATIRPFGTEKIDGLSSVPINTNYGRYRLVPISTGNWYID